MIIRLIELENFLNHGSMRLVLPESGLIHFSGRSTAGKTGIIIDAVGYALFGVHATRGKNTNDLRKIDSPGRKMTVRVTWEMQNGMKMTIERGIDDAGKSVAKGWDDAGGEANGPTPLKRYIAERVGKITWESYQRSYVTKQKDLEVLAKLKGSERKAYIHELLEIGDLDAMIKALARREAIISQAIQQLEVSTGGMLIADLQEQREQLALQVAEHDKQAAQLLDEIKSALEQADDLASQLKPMREKADIWQQYDTNQKVMTARRPDLAQSVQRLEKEAEQAQQYRQLVAREQEVLEQGTKLKESIEQLTALRDSSIKRTDLQNRANDNRQRRDEITKQAQALQDQLDQAAALQSVTEISEQMAAAVQQRKSTQERKDELTSNRDQLLEDGVCSTCLRPVEGDDRDALAIRFDEQIRQLDEALSKLAQTYEQAQQQLPKAQQAEQVKSKLAGEQVRIDHLAGELSKAEQELAALPEGTFDEQQLAKAEQARDEAREAYQQIRQAKAWLEAHPSVDEDLARTKAELKDLEAAIVSNQKWIDENPHDPSAYEKVAESEREQRKSAAQAQQRVNELEKHAGELGKEIVALDERMKLHAVESTRLEESREQKSRLSELANLVAGYRKQLVNETRPQLEMVCSQLIDQLSGGQTPHVSISTDYELSAEHTSGKELPWYMLSGGEDSRGNLALRLALSRLISQRAGSPIRYLVFDEIFGSSDKEHRAEMITLMRSLQAFYPQIFIIDHVGELVENSLVDYEVKITPGPNAPSDPTVELFAC